MRLQLAFGIILLGLSACDAQFTPETLVNTLRVLSVAAEPPEVAPGQRAKMTVLQTDPSRTGKPTTVIWIGCDPDPLDLGRSACTDASILLKPSLITDYPPGLNFLGIGDTADYASPATVFDGLPPESTIRRAGSVGVVIAAVIGEDVPVDLRGEKLKEMFQRIERKETQAVFAVSRVLVSEKPVRNQNPKASRITFDGQILPTGAHLLAKPGQQIRLGVSVSDDQFESYDELLPSGPLKRQESVVGAWYSSGGRFSQERFDLRKSGDTLFTAPGSALFPSDAITRSRQGNIWLVVRDNRGGQSFHSFRFHVCEPELPTPEILSIEPPTTPGDFLVVKGNALTQVLDVVIGDVAVQNLAYSPTVYGGVIAELKGLPRGNYPVSVRSKNCAVVDTGLTYRVD